MYSLYPVAYTNRWVTMSRSEEAQKIVEGIPRRSSTRAGKACGRILGDSDATTWAAMGLQRAALEWLCDIGAPYDSKAHHTVPVLTASVHSRALFSLWHSYGACTACVVQV